MINRTPYNTTFGQSIQSQGIAQDIRLAEADHRLVTIASSPDAGKVILKKIISSFNVPINTFLHPIYINDDKVETLYADFRLFVKPKDKSDMIGADNFIITNPIAAELSNVIMLLTGEWIGGDLIGMKLASPLAAKAFVNTLSNQVSHNININGDDTNLLRVILASYYNDLFYEKSNNPNKSIRLKNTLAYSGVNSSFVTNVFDKIPIMDTINDMAKVVSELTNNVNLKNFNSGQLLNMIGNITHGYNAKELLAVAVEHPPTWIALVAVSADNRAYKKTILASNIKALSRKDKPETLIKYIVKLSDIYFPNK